MPGEELIIDIEDNAETLPDLADAKKAVGTEPAKPIKVDEPVEDLRKQLQTLKEADAAKDAALATAQAEARQRAQEVENARRERDAALTGKVTSDASAIESAITAEKQAMASAKAAKIAAYQAGDFDKAADADELMATAAARLSRFEEAHEEIKSRIEKPVTQERKPAQADAFEQSISNVTPRAQAWLRAHPEFVTDTKLNNKAAAAHNMAKSEGHVVDSDAYYDFCERFLGLKKDESEPEPKPKPTRTKPMPSAPVSGGGGNGSGGGLSETKVALTPGEQERATDGTIVWNYTDEKIGAKKGEPIGLREMAKRKIELTKRGAYSREYTD